MSEGGGTVECIMREKEKKEHKGELKLVPCNMERMMWWCDGGGGGELGKGEGGQCWARK